MFVEGVTDNGATVDNGATDNGATVEKGDEFADDDAGKSERTLLDLVTTDGVNGDDSSIGFI